MDWPTYSPDLNPIEHVWDMLGRRIAARQPPPTCLPELWRTLLDEWCNIPQDLIDNLILSIPRRYFLCSGCRFFGSLYLPAVLTSLFVDAALQATGFRFLPFQTAGSPFPPPLRAAGSPFPPPLQASLIAITARISRPR
ncbi:transposable element Tcb2 transposase [Trichonephila clavipes]|nr:transposable element Tcb2 transposase [Trichonephila clavipes]